MNAIKPKISKPRFTDDTVGLVLRAKSLWHSYNQKNFVLEGVDLDLKEGMSMMVLGRSGSGKTTLIKILAGLVRPSRGQVEYFFDRDATPSSRVVAYIPQNLGLVRNLSALENVLMGVLGRTPTVATMFGRFRAVDREQAASLMADLGIGDKIEKKIWHLSGGERQRVAIARALIQNPRLILADEFVSQLDPVTSMEILAMVKKLTKNKIAFLATTHDVLLAKEYADLVVVMRNGKLIMHTASRDMSIEEVMKDGYE